MVKKILLFVIVLLTSIKTNAQNSVIKDVSTITNKESVLIDFGGSISESPWNNIANSKDGAIANLKNSKNDYTEYSLSVVDAFTHVNRNGTTEPNSLLNLPSSATRDSFFLNHAEINGVANPRGELLIENLNPNTEYEFSFFASRMGVSDNRETLYKVIGETEKSLYLNASSNINNSVKTSLKPDQTGTISIIVSKGSNNTNSAGYSYLDSIKINYEPTVITNNSPCKIVILGSSTAAGQGATSPEKSWAGIYKNHLKTKNKDLQVINLGRGGYTTYQILPTGTTLPSTLSSNVIIDEARNITRAFSLNPDAIIVNMPSNDTAKGYSVDIQMENFDRLKMAADELGIPIWIATTQPRNFGSLYRERQRETARRITDKYGNSSIDFWTETSDASGIIIPKYNSGDGIHLNDLGHALLFSKVKDKNIEDQICKTKNFENAILNKNISIKKDPSQNYLEVFSDIKGIMNLEVFDLFGKRIMKNESTIELGNNEIELNNMLLNNVDNRIFIAKIVIKYGNQFISKNIKFIK